MSRKPQANKHPALLVNVLAELGAGRITERFIHNEKTFVHGETTGRHITINPAVSVVDTVLHECLHRLRPQWAETYVRNRTTWLMARMSDEQIQAVYEQYQKRTRRTRPTRTPTVLSTPGRTRDASREQES